MDRETLLALSKDELVARVLAQRGLIEKLAAQIHTLSARAAELEARLNTPAKTPDNSSLPPSKGQKPNLPERGQKKPRPSRPGVTRKLAEHPDRAIEAALSACKHCARPLSLADQPLVHAYDRIDLPPIRPVVTRINRHRGACPCCRQRVGAPAPEGFEPGLPFGPGLCALAIHLHVPSAGFPTAAPLEPLAPPPRRPASSAWRGWWPRRSAW